MLARRYDLWKKKGEPVPQAQVALVALDPHTGEIRALVGGRNYGEASSIARWRAASRARCSSRSSTPRRSTMRCEGLQPVVTPVTTVVDEPTTFEFDGKEYTPNNYGEEFYGTVTVRDALIHSLNVATVKVAEMIGYQRVVDMARQMGLGPNIQPTPAVALGAYEMTPDRRRRRLHARLRTNGVRAEPLFIRSVVAADGNGRGVDAPRTHAVLDPRVAYLVTSLMEDVHQSRHGYPVRALGFTAPAAGKTGTSRDGWFAGYTSNLLCVVWVGFDDNRDLGLSGGQSAAPDLGGVHEARRRSALRTGTRSRSTRLRASCGNHRSAKRTAGHALLPADRRRVFRRGQRADAVLRASRRPANAGSPVRLLARAPVWQDTSSPVPASSPGDNHRNAGQSSGQKAPKATPGPTPPAKSRRRKRVCSTAYLVSLEEASSLRTTRNAAAVGANAPFAKGAGQ